MQVQRSIGQTPRCDDVATQLTAVHGPCVGCADCRGLCHALIEALFLPDILLKRPRG